MGWLSIVAGCLALSRLKLPHALTAMGAATVGAIFLLQSTPLGVGLLPDRYDVRWYREGPANTVTVFSEKTEPNRLKMSVDGIVIGESGGGVDEKQQMLAQLPFLLRSASRLNESSSEPSQQPPTSDSVLTIGLGTGILAGQVAQIPTVATVTCVELSPAVIDASREFSDANFSR